MIHARKTEYGELVRYISENPNPNGLSDFTDDELQDLIFPKNQYACIGVDYMTYLPDDELRELCLAGQLYTYISKGTMHFTIDDEEGNTVLVVRRSKITREAVNEDNRRFFSILEH